MVEQDCGCACMCDMRARQKRVCGTQHEGIHPWYHSTFQHGLLSTSDSALISIFKTPTPLSPWILYFHPMIIIEQHSSHSNDQHVQSEWPQVIFETLWHWDERPLQAKCALKVDPQSCTPCCSSAYTYGHHCGFWANSEWYHHFSSHSYWPTISSTFTTQRPYHLERLDSSWEGNSFVRVEARITPLLDHCWVDYTGVKFSTQVEPRSSDWPNSKISYHDLTK